jgi:hypothetical protein
MLRPWFVFDLDKSGRIGIRRTVKHDVDIAGHTFLQWATVAPDSPARFTRARCHRADKLVGYSANRGRGEAVKLTPQRGLVVLI